MALTQSSDGLGAQGARRGTPSSRRLFARFENLRGLALLAPTLVILGVTVVVPFALMSAMSFWSQIGFDYTDDWSVGNYATILSEPLYTTLLLRSLGMAMAATLLTVVLAYPMAYFLAFHVHRNKLVWLIIITLPFWTSYLLRVFAWRVILGYEGVINSGLMELGLIAEPLQALLYSRTAVIITLAHAWAAFALLPIYVSLEKIDKSVLEASADLGEGPVMRFFRVILPLSMPGVIAGTFLMFIPTVGDYVTPALVGGPNAQMIGNLVQLQFGTVNNWPMGAALAITMILAITLVGLIFLGLMWALRRWAR
ncbi:MAG: ABC transporter permease [Rhodobacteraceae bacterium]|nr:ABC transporter permease [Paracoccaceae bacterium]TVR46631.1 MAG: ABC transporter permease [Paracoccaceae bacterium]